MEPFLDVQGPLDQREKEDTRVPEVKGVCFNKTEQTGMTCKWQVLSSFSCRQAKQDGQVYQDYPRRTLFKFRTMCRRGKQVCVAAESLEKHLWSNVHVAKPRHLFSSSVSGSEVVGRRKRDRRQAGRG